MRQLLLLVFVILPVGAGGVYLWITPRKRTNNRLLVSILAYDIFALALAHFAFKAI
jgi:hypothetical protein